MKDGFSNDFILENSLEKLSLDEIHKRLEEMMFFFDDFCKEKGLTYFPGGGTLIGTIRHDGFIPWDDDVDFYMPREDYNKFITYSKITKDIDIVTRHSNNGYYHPFVHCNLSDKKTIIISHKIYRNTGKGQFVDIFPLDNVPDEENKKRIFMKSLYNKCRLCGYSIAVKRPGKSMTDYIVNAIIPILRHIDVVKLIDIIDLEAQSYNQNATKSWGPIACLATDRLIWKKEWFSSTFRHKFESIMLDVPAGYDFILTHTFGDYMQLPPLDQRGNQHCIDVYWRK